MRSTQAWFVILLLAVVVGLLGYALLVPEPEAITQWEYRIEGPDDSELRATLMNLGEAGWELAFARRATRDSEGAIYEMIFKRPIE